MSRHPAVRVTQMFPDEHGAFVAALIIRDSCLPGCAVETLTAKQVDALVKQLLDCKDAAKRGRKS